MRKNKVGRAITITAICGFFPAVNGDLLGFVAAVKMLSQDGLGVEVGSETGIAPHPRRVPPGVDLGAKTSRLPVRPGQQYEVANG